jgi:hypothetical protein
VKRLHRHLLPDHRNHRQRAFSATSTVSKPTTAIAEGKTGEFAGRSRLRCWQRSAVALPRQCRVREFTAAVEQGVADARMVPGEGHHAG